MATSFLTYGNTNFIANFKAALMTKNLITTVHFENSEFLVFTSSLSSKVFRVQFLHSLDTYITVSIGDAYSSGADVTNQVMILEAATSTDTNIKAVDYFLDVDKFIFVCQTVDGQQNCFFYAGKMDSGDTLVFGLGPYNTANNRARRLTDNAVLIPLFISTNGTSMIDASGNLFTFPLIFADSTGRILMNNTNPAKVDGVSLSTSTLCGKTNVYNGVGYYLTPSIMYMGVNPNLQVSLVIPYTS